MRYNSNSNSNSNDDNNSSISISHSVLRHCYRLLKKGKVSEGLSVHYDEYVKVEHKAAGNK